MKKTILIMVLLLSSSFVLGVAVGTVITQSQFDNINFQTRTIEYEIVSKEKIDTTIIVTVNYKTLEKRDTGDWIVILETVEFTYPLEAYHNCRTNNNTKTQCIQEAKDSIILEAKLFRDDIRNRLETQKTKAFIDELTVSDIDITNSQLNEEQ